MSSQTTIRPMGFFPALKYALLALAILAPVTTLAAAQDQASQTVEKLVDVGGYNLYFRIIPGQGSTILLESGGGMDSSEWNALAPRLAQETGATVIAYDRAGFGKSDHRGNRFPPQTGRTEGLAGVPRAIDGIDQGRHNGRRREERPYDPV